MQQRRAGSPFSERVSVTGPLQRADSLWSLREALNLLKIALLCHAQSHQDPVKPRHIDGAHGHSLWLRCWPLAHSNNITAVVYPAIPTSQLRSSSLIVSRRISGLRKLRVCGPNFCVNTNARRVNRVLLEELPLPRVCCVADTASSSVWRHVGRPSSTQLRSAYGAWGPCSAPRYWHSEAGLPPSKPSPCQSHTTRSCSRQCQVCTQITEHTRRRRYSRSTIPPQECPPQPRGHTLGLSQRYSSW